MSRSASPKAAVRCTGDGRAHHAQPGADVDRGDRRAVQLGRRLHHQVGQLDERDHLVDVPQHLLGRAGLVDAGVADAHQQVGLEQRPRAEPGIDRGAIAEQHRRVQHAPTPARWH